VRGIERYELALVERTAPPQADTFIRVNELQGSPDKVDAMIQFGREQVLPAVRHHPGFRAGVMGVNRQNGRVFLTSVWASAADREASDASLRALRHHGGQVAGGGEA
jgi:hypothetical protein